MKKFTIALVLLAIMAVPVFADNSENWNGYIGTVVLDGSTDWDSTQKHPNGMNIDMIVFSPSAANDNLVIRLNDANGVKIFPGKCTIGDAVKLDFPPKQILKPYIKAGDCTLSTPGSAWFTIFLRPPY